MCTVYSVHCTLHTTQCTIYLLIELHPIAVIYLHWVPLPGYFIVSCNKGTALHAQCATHNVLCTPYMGIHCILYNNKCVPFLVVYGVPGMHMGSRKLLTHRDIFLGDSTANVIQYIVQQLDLSDRSRMGSRNGVSLSLRYYMHYVIICRQKG